jgi:endo-alpha-1,4-polygalactosaminidase (GH114 family)
VDLGKLNGPEKMISVFGDFHAKKENKKLETRRENRELLAEVLKPVEGVDYLYEDSKAETQAYQDVYKNTVLREVRVTRCKRWRRSERLTPNCSRR